MNTTSVPAGWELRPPRQSAASVLGGWLAWGRWVLGPVGAGAVFLAHCLALPAWADGNPYADIIIRRNVFGLKDPPPPPPPPDTTPPVPKLTLVGIANVFGTRKAVLKTQPAPGTPPKPGAPGGPPPGQEPPLVLTEGSMQDGVTVISIDEGAGIVKVDNHGQALTLSFDKDGLKVPSGPAGPAPGQPGLPGQPAIPRPPGMPGTVTVGGQPGQIQLPAGMTEEMRQRFAQRYGIQAPGMPAVPMPPPVPGAVSK